MEEFQNEQKKYQNDATTHYEQIIEKIIHLCQEIVKQVNNNVKIDDDDDDEE